MSDLWIIVCVFCCFSLTECQTVSIQHNRTDWFTAFQTCKNLSGRLPDVNISKHQLELQDISVTNNISSPFWIGATYDLLDINVAEPHYGYNYPNTCCETIQNFYGYRQVQCSDCLKYNGVICVTSTNEIPSDRIIGEYCDWHGAFLKCKNRKLTLPTRENQQFLAEVTHNVGAFWLDGIRQINFMPDIGIQNRSCLYSLSGSIHEGNCYNTSMTTVCVFDKNISGSESNTYTPYVNTEARSKVGSLQAKTNGAKYTIYTLKTTESMQFQTTTNGTSATSANIHATFASLANMAADEERVIDTGAVIGGVVGSVLVAIVITAVIVILVRKHRSRKDNNDQKERQFNAANQEKPGIMNSCFGVRRNSSLEKGNTKATNQAETTKDFRTQSQKHMMKEQQSSKHGKAVESTYERVVSVLYSVVQKDLKPIKTRHCGEQVKGSEENDDYEKTSYCNKINQAASSGNVYDKANFKHHDNSEYDTTRDIHFKHNGNSEYDTTKDMNFKHTDNSEYDMMKDINISIDATYDHV